VTTVINVLEGYCYDVHVVVCIDTARNAETKKVETSETILSGNRVAVSKDITDLTATDSGLDI
jgi:hypothetical protein